MAEKIPAGKDLAGKRPAGKKPSGEKTGHDLYIYIYIFIYNRIHVHFKVVGDGAAWPDLGLDWEHVRVLRANLRHTIRMAYHIYAILNCLRYGLKCSS